MRVNERMKKVFSILLCLCMVLQYVPTTAFAVDTADGRLCAHHTEHTAECHYAEAVEGQPCTHVHDELCGYREAVAEVKCACEATDENGALVHTEGCGYVAPVTGADCTHSHDDACGYVESVSGADCTYHCHICHVQTLVDALPDEVTAENAEAVATQLTAIDEEKASLSDEELAQVDFAKYTAAISAINALENQSGAEIPVVVFSLSVTVDGIAYSIEAESSDTIEAVKTKITEAGAVLVNPKLYLGEKELEDGRTLADYDISAGSAVSVTNYYNIFIAEAANGMVEANQKTAHKGCVVSLTVTADEGYKLNTLTVTYGENQPVDVAEDNTFTMPAGNVTVTATFKATCTCEIKCSDGSVNSNCEVCTADISDCIGTETVVNIPQTLTICGESVISAGTVETTSGEGWSYDSATNTLTLTNATLTYDNDSAIYVQGGDLTIKLVGTNVVSAGDADPINYRHNNDSNHLTILGDGTLTANGRIFMLMGFVTIENTVITCTGIKAYENLTIRNSTVIADGDEWAALYSVVGEIALENSYVVAKSSYRDGIQAEALRVTNSQVEAVGSAGNIYVDSSTPAYANSVVTEGTAMTVYGTATLREALTVASGETINFMEGASITNPEKLTVEEGATILVNGEAHAHNTDGGTTYTQESENHVKKVVCKDCPVGYVVVISEAHTFSTDNICTFCGVQAQAKIGDTYYLTLAEAAGAVTAENNTIEVLTDVTISADETLTFATLASLNVADGKNITCNGTVKIGEADGIIFENSLYYYGEDITGTGLNLNLGSVTFPIYYTAGEGCLLWLSDYVVELHNASITNSGNAIYREGGDVIPERYTIQFFGENKITSMAFSSATDNFPITLEAGEQNAVLTVTAGITCGPLTVKSGTVNVTTNADGIGIHAGGLTVETGAIVNVSAGNSESESAAVMIANTGTVTVNGTLNTSTTYGIMGTGELTVGESGVVNGLVLKWDIENDKAIISTVGNAVISADMAPSDIAATVTFTVPVGTTLTVNEGVTLDLSSLAVADIDFSGTVINNGTIILPADFVLDNAPKSGTVKIGEKSYNWNGEKWICAEGSHTPAADSYEDKGDGTHSYICSVCGQSVSEAHIPDANGYTDKSGTTHSYTCGLCGGAVTEAHTFADGACTVCGVIGGYCGGEGDGTNLVWTREGEALTISGTGAMGDTSGVGDHKVYISSVTIGTGVTTISNDAFNANNRWAALQTVNLPDSLTTIGDRAFMMTSPTSITIPKGVTSIGAQAFLYCPLLDTVTIPASVTSIGYGAFSECDKLTTVNVPCNWDGSLYTFEEGVKVNQPDHTIPTNGDGTQRCTCTTCGTPMFENCVANMDSATGKCTFCNSFIAEASVTSGGTVTYYPYADLVLTETAAVLNSGDTVHLLKNYETSANLVIPEGVTFDGGEFTLTSAGSGTLENNGTITGGTYSSSVNNRGTITGGTFSSSVTNNGTITGGTFNDKVANYNTTTGGTFETLEFHDGTISGTVKITSCLKIWGETNSADTLINLRSADLGEGISLNYYHQRIMYVGEQIVLPEGYCLFPEDGAYTETLNYYDTWKYVIRKHSHELNSYGYDSAKHWQTCDCGYVDTTPHTPTYSANGSTIIASCSVNCGYIGTATISAENTTYDGNAKETAAVVCSDNWIGDTPTPAYVNNINAGTATASISIGDAAASVDFTIAKAKLTVTAGERSIIYGEAPTHGGVEYSGFANGETERVLGGSLEYSYDYAKGDNAGSYTITPGGLTSGNYDITFVPGTLTVDKAEPIYTAPTGLTATYGDTLSSVALPDGWAWTDSTVSVGNVGSRNFTATFTPDDLNNYNTVENVPVAVTIQPKKVTITGLTAADRAYNGEKTVTLSGGSVDGAIGSDNVTVDLSAAVGTMADTNAGENKAVTVTGVRLGGDAAGNYELTAQPSDVTITIKPKFVAPTTFALSFNSATYTGVEIKPDVTVEDGDTTLIKDVDYTVSYSNNINVGHGAVRVAFIGNYGGSVEKIFAITRAPLTVTADDKTMTTGQTLPTFTYTITGFVSGETENVLTTKPTAETTADGKTVGSYDITVSGAEADNYSFSYVTGTLSVVDHQHAWTYAANGATITATCGNADTCPDAEQSITLTVPENYTYTGDATYSASVAGRIEDVTHTVLYTGAKTNYSSADVPKDADTYTVTLSAGDKSVSDTFTISPKDISVVQSIQFSLNETSFVYSGKAPELTVNAVDSSVGRYTMREGTDYTVGTAEVNAGSHKLTVTGKGNYTGTVELDYTITAKEVSITSAVIKAVTYDPDGYTLTVTGVTFDGVVDGETLAYTAEATLGNTNAVGEQDATVRVTLNNSNYNLVTATYQTKVTINKANQADLIITGQKDSPAYGDSFALGTSGGTTDGAVTWAATGTASVDESGKVTTTGVGSFTITATMAGGDNYNDVTDTWTGTSVKADPVIGTVGCEMPLFDSTAASAVELTRTDMSVDGTLILMDSELTAGEGTYNWKFTPKDTNNYNTITGTVTLTVTADVLEKIEASGTLTKSNYVYGDTFSIDGLTVTATYTSGATKDVTADVSFNSTLAVGQTSVVLTYQGKACEASGITVAKKQLIIFGMAWDIPENAVYSGTAYNAILTGNLPEGVTVTKTGDMATNAGDYTAKAVFSLAEGYSADNYEIVNGGDLTADWTIAKKNIAGAQITLGTTLTYNGEQQTQTVASVKIDGLTVTYTVSGNTGTDAKGYTLTVAGNGNFEGTETKEWSIAKKNISGATITLGDSLTYNGNERTQEVTDVKIDDLTVTYDVTANKQTNAGNYTLTVTGNGNFEGSATADWSIAKAKLTITANDNSITYGDVPVANGVTGTGFVSTESIEDLSGELTYSYSYEQFGNVGTYKIAPSGVTSGNYEIIFVDGTLTVNAKPITVTADAVSKTYGEADPTLTCKVEGLVNGDELTGELKRVAGENVGSYAIEQNTLTAGNNYRLTYTGAKLTINAKAITAADVKLNSSLTYNGKEQTQPITVTEGITYEVSSNKATNVGSYELTVKGTDNYTGSITLNWTIAKAKLTITADSKVIYIGEKLPTLTYTVSGLVGGDKLTKEPALTTNADAGQAGSYTITAANADAGDNYTITYVSSSLTIMDKETEVETKIVQTELTEIPDGLKDTQFDTVEEIKEELISKILATYTGYSAENMVHYDVTLHFSLDGGDSWILATEQNFPTEGITVILPYPEGTNARDYEFVVSHMFTVTSQRLGTVAGEVEMPKVEETANGIRVTLNGLSPVTVAARYHDHTGGTATCTEKAVCTICGNAYGEVDKTNHAAGTEVKDAKEATCGAEGYTGDTYCKGCNEVLEKGTAIKATGEHTYGDWKVVKEPTKTTKGEKQRTCSVCGHVDSKEIPVLSDTPATGDDSNIILYGSMFTVSLAGLVVLLLAAKKRKQENA